MILLREKLVKVRKGRQCCWCWEEIPVRTMAQKQTTVDGDGVGDVYLHPECYEASCKLPSDDLYFSEGSIEPFRRGSTEKG